MKWRGLKTAEELVDERFLRELIDEPRVFGMPLKRVVWMPSNSYVVLNCDLFQENILKLNRMIVTT